MPEYIERAYIMGKITSSEMQAELKQMDGAGAYNRVIGIINAAPAAEVDQVRHGRWEVYLGGKEIMCSSCKTTFFDEEQVGGSNYCPNCGAKMDGGTE